jgi:small subunit ribosomal protein S6
MHPRRYETLILLSPNLSPIDMEKFKTKVAGILDAGNAKVVQIEDWGRKMLAYPVHKEHYGIYVLYDYQASPAVEAELKRNLKIDENVFKSLTLVLDRQFTDQRFEEEKERILAKSQKKEELAGHRETPDHSSNKNKFDTAQVDELPENNQASSEAQALPSESPATLGELSAEATASSEYSPAPPTDSEAKAEGETV